MVGNAFFKLLSPSFCQPLDMNTIEQWVRWLGGLALLLVLGIIFLGIWHGVRQPAGLTAGRVPGLLRSSVFYVSTSMIFFGVCFLLWKPLPLVLSIPVRTVALVLGSLLFFGGLALTAWARWTLGRNYFVSTALGVQLFAGHQLVTSGPFAWIRHPMYLGLILTNLGGLLLYRTWTFLILSVGFLGLVLRAWREEQALQAAFGQDWTDYCRKIPAWLPRLHSHRNNPTSKITPSTKEEP